MYSSYTSQYRQPYRPQPSRDRRRHGKMRLLFGLLAVALVCLLGFKLFAPQKNSNKTNSSTTAKKVENADTHPDRIRLIGAGDFVGHSTLHLRAKKANGSYDYMPMMRDFMPIFARADIRFCNQATGSGGEQFGISGYPKFNAPTQFATDMARLGCNLVNLASNHSFDVSQGAINATLDTWAKQPKMLAVAGENHTPEEQQQIKYFTVKGAKFAFLAYTTYINSDAPVQNSYGVNVYSDAWAKQQIDAAKAAGAQIIIVSMRWGTEYSPAIDARQEQAAQFLADQGVSLVLGHGNHVLQPVKKLAGAGGNETVVWYSLGNFLNTQVEPEGLFNGLAVVDFSASTHQITGLSYLPAYMHYEWSDTDAASENYDARNNMRMYLLDKTTQSLIDKNQLKTSVEAQHTRIQQTLNTYTPVQLLTAPEYYR